MTEVIPSLAELSNPPYRARAIGEVMRVGDYIVYEGGRIESILGWRDNVFADEIHVKMHGVKNIYTTDIAV